ncbi:MAG: hypothetical protein VKP72_08900 [bacterium]|nr:hypothetical protein [bacterium]
MGSFKHYLPAASGAEQTLLEDLAREHVRHLHVHARQIRDTSQLFFEADDANLAGFIWFLLARLRRMQRQVEALYQAPSGPVRAEVRKELPARRHVAGTGGAC